MIQSPSSPKSRNGSPTGRASSAAVAPTTPSFFIIQEPIVIRASPPSPTATEKSKTPSSASPVAVSSASRGELERQRNALASRQSQEPTHSLNSGSPGPRRRRDRTSSANNTAATLREETEQDLLGDSDEEQREAPSMTAASKPRVLSILNRCGSSPELPLHNSFSSTVFTTSKKRQLLKPTTGTGASPHLAAMQRSRLIPLPINIRTGTLKKSANEEESDSTLGTRSSSLSSLRDARLVVATGYDDAEDTKMNYEITITSLKQRLAQMEKDSIKALKQRQALERQIDALVKEQHALRGERAQLTKKLQDLETANLHQRHAFDKLSERYSTVYSNLAKVTEVSGSDLPQHVASMHVVVQTLARENQELQRKVLVLETRRADDKIVVANQEKQIKRLRAEMEALQHMAGSKEESSSISKNSQLSESTGGFAGKVARSEASSSSSAALQQVTPGSQSQNEETAYIDPNILKVLEKVDSQFSITNAIALSAVLKKWLHSCLHIVASTDLHGVLHVLLKRVCELLHCQHAAVFYVDNSAKKLISVASERGLVRWEMPLDKGILGHAARHNILCNVRKAYDDPRFFSSSDTITGTKSREVLCIPLTRELDTFQPDSSSTVATSSVFAVLQCWNTTSQKPFTQNDQILGGLLAIHAGIVLSQTKLSDTMQRVHNRVLQITHMDKELAPKALVPNPATDSASDAASAVSIVHLVRAAQRKLAEIVGITKLRIFVLDSDVMRVWHVGAAKLEAGVFTQNDLQLVPVRKYANVHSSLCALLVEQPSVTAQDGTTDTDSITASANGCRILLDPTAEPTFNDTVDLKGGANGLYIAPIRSPWQELPLGMIQVARSGAALESAESRPMSTATKKERRRAQEVDDELTMELIELFCKQFASLLHHALSVQLRETCPRELLDARLSYLTDRLDFLEAEYLREQEEAEAEAAAMTKQAQEYAEFEQRLLGSAQNAERRFAKPITPSYNGIRTQRDNDLVFEPVPLISTDSSYAIDLLGSKGSPEDGSGEDINTDTGNDDEEAGALSSASPCDIQSF